MHTVINVLFQVFSVIIIADVIVSYILSPYHPIREFLDKIVHPLLAPIQKIIPPIGGFDFSPVILLLIVQLIARLLLMIV
jgi:YggT family protein